MYGITLLATLPLVGAAVALVLLRRSGAGGRAVACRAAVVALLAMYAGRFLPVHWMVWIVPEGLATPLVALGRVQLSIVASLAGGHQALADAGPSGAWGGVAVRVVLAMYWGGVAFVLLRLMRARWRLGRLAASAKVLDSRAWRSRITEAARAAGLEAGTAGRVRLLLSPQARVPMTWGGGREPVIVLPPAAPSWDAAQLHAALVHECSHVRHGDSRSALASQLMCALYWFHPGAWWLDARLQRESELACDDRVLLTGVRRSDYAELLLRAIGAPVRGGRRGRGGRGGRGGRAYRSATALVHPAGVRARLAAIVDTSRVVRAPSPAVFTLVVSVCALLSIPLGTVRVSPTREVLTTLMRDVRWESRAYAVVRLAQRADSVHVARDAADHDPSPRVRAWAHFALAQGGSATERPARGDQLPDVAGWDSTVRGVSYGLADPAFLH